MPYGLFENPFPGINQYYSQISSACTGNHIPCILNMSRGIGNNEFSCRSCKIPVGNINCDTLFALSSQAVCKERQIKFFPSKSFS